MTKVKICGITNLRDARACANCGADFLGFVFYKKSPRYIAPAEARKIIAKVKRPVFKVGVFVNETPRRVRKIARDCRLDVLQFHGDESRAYLAKFRDYPVIKAVRVRKRLSGAGLKSYGKAFLLFDTFQEDAFGGTGRTFDWKLLAALKKLKNPFIVSGGLTVSNVRGLLSRVRPFCVDVSSGVEKKPGIKDLRKVKRFIKAVKG